jgi:hypothetical protein
LTYGIIALTLTTTPTSNSSYIEPNNIWHRNTIEWHLNVNNRKYLIPVIIWKAILNKEWKRLRSRRPERVGTRCRIDDGGGFFSRSQHGKGIGAHKSYIIR